MYGDVYLAVGTAGSLEMSGLKSAQLQIYAAMTLGLRFSETLDDWCRISAFGSCHNNNAVYY